MTHRCEKLGAQEGEKLYNMVGGEQCSIFTVVL